MTDHLALRAASSTELDEAGTFEGSRRVFERDRPDRRPVAPGAFRKSLASTISAPAACLSCCGCTTRPSRSAAGPTSARPPRACRSKGKLTARRRPGA